MWVERIVHHGVDPITAEEMARQITALLAQVFLTRGDDFYNGLELEDEDLRVRQILLEKLGKNALP